MSKKIAELKEMRGKAVADGRVILDKAAAEKRSMNAEEKVQYESFISDATRIGEDIATEERQLSLEKEMLGLKLA